MREKILATIKRAIQQSRTALICCHVDPDGDTIGSAIALALALEQQGVKAKLYSQDGVPSIYHYLPLSDKFVKKLDDEDKYDLGITVDASDIKRIGQKINLKEVCNKIINIDHHPDNTNFADFNFVEKSSSTAEQIYYLCKYLEIKMDKKIAECLYTAMITDTGNFRYENTSKATFQIAAELLETGINTHQVSSKIYDTKSLASIKISAQALSQLEFSPDYKVAWATITEEMMQQEEAKNEDLIGIIDQIRALKDVEVAILFRQEKHNMVKINFRSKHQINVGKIANFFGGGGHVKAAGTTVEGTLSQVKAKVTAKVCDQLTG